ncbi:hypothetical protein K2173_014622 [Erythroxylum novogranatense]|uniref:VQ domain-containing protein n=1 Tax=Erythroxylum novogranatense TaxID=1862640 RepID=A0AAV8TGU8_9ROSI|nr:hypothetical protein K2173_014622 [Erythroxylum novogranatense]
MDSGNSGSVQSSSSGDEEFDSRAESISAFLNNTSNNHHPLSRGPMLNPPPQPSPPTDHHYHHHHHASSSSSMFDPFSNYFDPVSRSTAPPPLTNPNSILNLDVVWSKNLRSEPSCNDLGGFITTSSPTQQLFTNQTESSRNRFVSPQILPGIQGAPPRVSGSNDHQNNSSNSVSTNNSTARNPKKRSRASRRAPTTVLTTDTNNFRAMVQEFTGIPAPPFTSSSPFPRTRLDLFGTVTSSFRSAITSPLDPSVPLPYLLQPFPQKVRPPPTAPPFLSQPSSSANSLTDGIASTTTSNINASATTTTATTNSSTSVNYHLPSDLGFLKQQSQNNLLNINMQNPILNFHSILQAPTPKYPLTNSTILGSTGPQQQSSTLELPSSVSHLKMGGLEDFGLSHGHVNTGLQNMVSPPSSDASTLRRSSDSNTPNWADGAGSNEGNDHQGLLRSINGSSYNNSQRVTNGKAHYSGSNPLDFNVDKGLETVGVRSEGMVESWICSSD